jgi:hypothetical protein
MFAESTCLGYVVASTALYVLPVGNKRGPDAKTLKRTIELRNSGPGRTWATLALADGGSRVARSSGGKAPKQRGYRV